jgi:ketosteroid isomerase-like protein
MLLLLLWPTRFVCGALPTSETHEKGDRMHANEQSLRTNYGAFASGDMGTMLDSLDHNIQWHVTGPSPLRGEYSGKEAVLRFFEEMMALYGGTLRLEVVDVLANDRHGVVLTKERGEYAGRQIEYEGVHRWDFHGGKWIRFENYYDDTYHAFWSSAQ